MNPVEILGLIAGAFCTVSTLPQIVKAARTRSTTDLSLGMCILNTAALSFWLTYGILASLLSVIVFNTVAVVLFAAVLVLKIKYN